MVELKDESNNETECSEVTDEPRSKWPYILLSLGCLFVAVGVCQLKGFSGGCPFHMVSGITGENKGSDQSPHYDTDVFSEELVYGSKKKLADVYNGRVVTKAELAKYGGTADVLWVSVLGHVYDVTSGMRHYGNHGTYNFFTGKDGSRAYSTGVFTEEGLVDDVSGLTPKQLGEIFHWINIFSKKYPLVGRLEGPFFTGDGTPTPMWRDVETSLEILGHHEEERAALFRMFPSCNSHYDRAAGKAEVWCTQRSGGVSRTWTGLPRQLHLPGESVRCACVQEHLLSDPKLREYEGCPPTSTSCKLKLS